MTEDRLKTGIEGLDEVLEGGFIPGVSVLLEGPPETPPPPDRGQG